MANYFRSDGWVKSALGPAVPGAQVYLCLQPANIATLPPSPLVNIFSDPRGLVPITQPIITDGFGHYDFYAQAGVYTLIVGLGGIIQQVYPDQSSGGASTGGSGGTAIILQTNGTNNANQLLLNLIGAGSIAVTDEGNGTIAIAGAVFQTNGAPNTVQNKLNLIAGANIVLSSDTLGDVTIAGTATAPIATYMIGAGLLSPPQTNPSGFYPGVDAALDVMAVRFSFPSTLTFNTVSFAWTTGGAASNIAFALYSSVGSLLWQSGPLPVAGFTSGNTEATVPSYTLLPGAYYLATTASAGAGTVQIFGWPLNTVTSGADNCFNFSKPIIGIAANPATNLPLAFPNTLGAVNGTSAHGNTWSLPAIGFYNLP